jgi:hypothetical protein
MNAYLLIFGINIVLPIPEFQVEKTSIDTARCGKVSGANLNGLRH